MSVLSPKKCEKTASLYNYYKDGSYKTKNLLEHLGTILISLARDKSAFCSFASMTINEFCDVEEDLIMY
jgi:hypothetical protein